MSWFQITFSTLTFLTFWGNYNYFNMLQNSFSVPLYEFLSYAYSTVTTVSISVETSEDDKYRQCSSVKKLPLLQWPLWSPKTGQSNQTSMLECQSWAIKYTIQFNLINNFHLYNRFKVWEFEKKIDYSHGSSVGILLRLMVRGMAALVLCVDTGSSNWQLSLGVIFVRLCWTLSWRHELLLSLWSAFLCFFFLFPTFFPWACPKSPPVKREFSLPTFAKCSKGIVWVFMSDL